MDKPLHRQNLKQTQAHARPAHSNAGAIVRLADTSSGDGCMAHLPEGATGFTTVALKSNNLGTALALFRCTQMVLYPKGA